MGKSSEWSSSNENSSTVERRDGIVFDVSSNSRTVGCSATKYNRTNLSLVLRRSWNLWNQFSFGLPFSDQGTRNSQSEVSPFVFGSVDKSVSLKLYPCNNNVLTVPFTL